MSVTIQGLIVALLGIILKATGTPFLEGDLAITVNTLITLVGVIVAWYGRVRRGDISIGGVRK